MQLTYLDFELEIGLEQGRDFPLIVRSPAGEARATMRFPFDELALKGQLQGLQIALLRSGGNRRQVLSPEQQAVRAFGQTLFDSLFIGEVRNRYDVSLQQARNLGKGLRIRLQTQSPAAASLPWEYLYDPRQSEYCTLSVETPLVRYLHLPQPLTPLTVAPPLRMLGMVVGPENLPALDVDQEKQRIEQSIQSLRSAGRMDIEWLSGQTWRDLQEALHRGPWHIFHFSGHGGFDALTDEGQLIFADDRGRAHPMPASNVGRLLANHRTLRLAWLNACEGARGGEQDIFSSAASILVRRGIPAVIAMQYEITDRAAIELAQTFYKAVADGYPVDAALAEARVGVSVAVNNTVEWGTPVLYTHASDGLLFDLTGLPNVQQSQTANPAQMIAKPAPKRTPSVSDEAVSAQPVIPPVVRPALPRAAQKPKHRSVGRMLLAIAALALVLGVIVLITNVAGLLPKITQRGVTSTAGAVVVRDKGATVIEPIRLEMVQVPAGDFLMGSDPAKDEMAQSDEQPQRRVSLAEYYIGEYEVTNAQYSVFLEATGHEAPDDWDSIPVGKEDHPVVNVSWTDAIAFTDWLGKETGRSFRLPTEAEWEKACRETAAFIYPWGDEFDADRANTKEAGIGTTTAVGTHSPGGNSQFGVADMAGNVWEMTSTLYMNYPYDSADGRERVGIFSDGSRVRRGGSFSNDAAYVRCAVRTDVNVYNRDVYTGFRVALSSP